MDFSRCYHGFYAQIEDNPGILHVESSQSLGGRAYGIMKSLRHAEATSLGEGLAFGYFAVFEVSLRSRMASDCGHSRNATPAARGDCARRRPTVTWRSKSGSSHVTPKHLQSHALTGLISIEKPANPPSQPRAEGAARASSERLASRTKGQDVGIVPLPGCRLALPSIAGNASCISISLADALVEAASGPDELIAVGLR